GIPLMTIKKFHAVVAVLGIAITGAAAWWLQNHDKLPEALQASAATAPRDASAGEAALVEVGRVEAVTLEEDAQAVGTLRARQGVMLRPEVSGRGLRTGVTGR